MSGWRDRAACNLADARLFDPLTREELTTVTARIDRARALCARCPVADACATDARASRDSGIRAGVMLEYGRPVADPRHVQRPVAACGTLPGARRHYDRREPLCPPCRAVENDYQREKARNARAARPGHAAAAARRYRARRKAAAA